VGRHLSDGDLDVLFVCTANQCRSPLAAALLRQRRPWLLVASAGVREFAGPAMPSTVRAAEPLGVDLSDHRSRPVDDELIARSGLVIGMTRGHVREIVVRDPSAFARTFTFRELVRRAEAAGRRPVGTPFPEWLALVGAGRSPRDMLGSDDADDIADPGGHSQEVHDAIAGVLVDLVDRLVTLAAPT
jgi:protein-tyrosine phosphatase